MRTYRGLVWQIFLAAFIFVLFCSKVGFGQQSSGSLRGQVADELGGLIVGATVTAADASGVEKTSTTDDEGRYSFSSLPPGRYTVRVVAPGFALYENAEVEVAAGRTDPLNITLPVAIEEQVVTVTEESEINTDPENNAGALVLRGADLDSLPDDPDALADALQALAGPSTGAEGGGEIFLDGFSGGRLPPKESIREIRINRNPFSAEYDRVGYGRIEIFTKPGTDKFRGQAFFNFNDEALNARDPFAPNRAPFQRRRYGGNLSGPLVSKRASFFFDFQRNESDDNEVINAVILDPQLNPTPFSQAVVTPRRSTTFSPRLDWQLNQTNTLVARYSYERTRRANVGVGDFSLLSRAYDTSGTEHTLQLTETAVINQKVINETRFQYVRARSISEGNNSEPTIRVLDAFTGGGSQVGLSFNDEDRFELQNYTSWTMGNHSLKAGARLRHTRLTDVSRNNFGGTYVFSTLEQYRNVLLGVAGARPSQFTLAGGNPEVRVTQTDFSPFIQDDWRVRPNLTLSLGLRYEAQTNIDSRLDFAPRVAFAWSPGAGGGGQQQQRTVIRGGFGIFYNRVGQNLTLQSERFNGVNQQQFVVTAGNANGLDVLDLFPTVPTLEELAAFSIPQTTRTLADDLRAPYTIQTGLSVERQLPYRIALSVNFVSARTLHVLRSRNINAPLPGTFVPGVPGSGVRPFPGLGNIFQYESSGHFNQNQLIVSLNNRFSPKLTLFATYTLNDASSDTDGAGTFPVNQYDLSGEYGRSSQDIRHRLFLGGQINALPWGIRLNPFVTFNSGRPFNIITGRDTNGDTLFTERPAFATDLSKPGVVITRYGAFDPNPEPSQELIPRNFGTGPSFFAVNLRASKTFSFGETPSGGAQAGGGGRGGRGGRGGGGGGGGRGGRGGGGFGGGGGGGEAFGGGGEAAGRYNLTFSVNVNNLFNNTNAGTPIGNLSSPLFGQSNASAGRFGFGGGGGQQSGARSVELQLRFSF